MVRITSLTVDKIRGIMSTMLINRELFKIINKIDLSILLIGPRQVGKSTLMKGLSPDLTINLANESTFLEFASDPGALEARLKHSKPKTIFIDEIQRLPSLLNTIQSILDDSKKGSVRFFLTGSSARKLRRGNANLLPGRVISLELGPLNLLELQDDFYLDRALRFGTLPGVYLANEDFQRELLLSSYGATYLKEEIQAEALTRDIEGFARFLRVTAATAGSFLDMSKLASEASVKRASAIRFFDILEDSLIVKRCDAFAKSERRRLIQHPRYFYFDNGVLNGVLGNFVASPDRIGALFEHFVFTQLHLLAQSTARQVRITNYRTEHGAEVDFIFEIPGGDTWAIECKAGRVVGKNDLHGFDSFANYFGKPFKKMIVYSGDVAKAIQDVEVLPVLDAILQLSRELK